ncbi:MarR family winged helix-turn-helix transcriptional regulator [Rhizohabitans arisaemae]|uniref:MarR family winged helix-turn-helix transcriptional regulator n=1 Tax=Rhizohabitans arisaemae TaxID=2720610 RepID=UPI0024B0CD09|nr:MarR family transcriptional regulator [Rhizohabitans arisaemae]
MTTTKGSIPTLDPIEEIRRQWGDAGLEARDAIAAAISVVRAQQLIQERIDAALAPHNLTMPRFEALMVLMLAPGGSLPLGKLSEMLMVHPATVTNTVDRLETRGLVRRVGHPADRRTKLAQLTETGRRVTQQAIRAVAQTNAGMAELSQIECIQIARLIRRLRLTAGDLPGREDSTPPSPPLWHSG